ncbi:MAG: hypothetical protein EPN75_08890 [Beijerinckiaceae bacterium]|nr:MAG: hypothetical protein EPN75_08890 [Beijerinckiaceae bacterium]
MGSMTYYVALPFLQDKNGAVIPGTPRECPTPAHAVATARRLAVNGAGAVAFSRSGDPSTGEFSDAIVIATFGETASLDDLVDANY